MLYMDFLFLQITYESKCLFSPLVLTSSIFFYDVILFYSYRTSLKAAVKLAETMLIPSSWKLKVAVDIAKRAYFF